MGAALKLAPMRDESDGRVRLADDEIVIKGEPRALAVSMFRDLANGLENGELDGARVQWRDGLLEIETVTLDADTVRLTKFTIEEV